MYDCLLFAVFIYIIMVSLVFIIKPSLVYDSISKTPKEFGFDSDKTYLPLPTLCCLLAVISYLISCFIVNEMLDNDY